MAEVAVHVGEDHRNAVFIGSGNDFIITDRTAKVDHTAHANGGSGINTVTERKNASEAIAGTFHFQTFVSRFNASDFRGVHAGSSGLRLWPR